MSTFSVRVLKQTENPFNGDALSLLAPTVEGDIAIFKGHTPLIAKLKKGTLKISTLSGDVCIPVRGGFIHVSPRDVSFVVF
ncbi:MAG: ATP synthase epsilon chain, sodium ion specific [Holosporales bacterium]